jgi:hypothetical protein
MFAKRVARSDEAVTPPSPASIGGCRLEHQRREGRHHLDGALERRKIVQVPDHRRVVTAGAPLPREDAPGERTQFVGRRLHPIDAGERRDFWWVALCPCHQ